MVSTLEISLLNVSELETLALGDRDDGFLSFSDDEDIVESGSETMSVGISDVSDIERTRMLLDVREDTNSTNIVTTSAGNSGSILVLNHTDNFASLEVKL